MAARRTVESGYCAFSVMSPRTGKRLRVADNSYRTGDSAYQRACTAQTGNPSLPVSAGVLARYSDGTASVPWSGDCHPGGDRGELLATYHRHAGAWGSWKTTIWLQQHGCGADASDPNRLNTLFPPDYVNNQLRVVSPWLTSSVFSIQRSLHNGPYRGTCYFKIDGQQLSLTERHEVPMNRTVNDDIIGSTVQWTVKETHRAPYVERDLRGAEEFSGEQNHPRLMR